MLESMSTDQFDRHAAYDAVVPLDHTEKMLGLIGWMLAAYLDMKIDDDELKKMCMPWIPEQRLTSKSVKPMLPKRDN